MVHASAVTRVLIGWDCVFLHVCCVGMAPGAGLGHVGGVNFGARVTCRTHAMHSVAIDADGYLGIASREQFAVDAGLVLSKLVGAERRVVLAHVSGVGVTLAAQGRDVLARGLATEATGFAHRVHVTFRGVATVATGAGETFLRVDILGKMLLRNLLRGVERGMTFDTTVGLFGSHDICGQQSRQE